MSVTEHGSRLAPTGAAEPYGVVERIEEPLERRRAGRRPLRRGWLMRRMLLAADLVGLATAFLISGIASASPRGDHVPRVEEVGFFLASIPVWIVLAKLYGLYERDEERADHSTVDDVLGVFHLVTLEVWIFYLAAAATHLAHPPLTRVALFWALATGLVIGGRAIARASCRRSLAYLQNTIIVGAGDVGQVVARKLLNHPEYGINIVGFVDAMPKIRREDIGELALLGPLGDLAQMVPLFDVERVIIAFSNDSHEEILTVIRSLNDLDVQIDIVPRLFDILGAKVSIHTVEGLPLVGLPPLRLSRSSRLLKRTMDLMLTVIALFVLAPVFVALAIAIKLDSKGPIFFRQTRMGSGERTFRIFKFRTMTEDAEHQKEQVAHLNMHRKNGGDPRMFKVPDDPRVTRIGRFLRRYSLDELPQLLNVIKGDMSLVGPRPLILDEDRWIKDWARKRLSLRPGVTGLWQSLGASGIPFDEMTRLDYLYVTNWSLAGDVRLVLRTVPTIFRKRRAY